MHELGVRRKGDRLALTVVSTMTLEKSAGLAAPVRVATDRLSSISAASFSSPIRSRQRVSDERSDGYSANQLEGPSLRRQLIGLIRARRLDDIKASRS